MSDVDDAALFAVNQLGCSDDDAAVEAEAFQVLDRCDRKDKVDDKLSIARRVKTLMRRRAQEAAESEEQVEAAADP